MSKTVIRVGSVLVGVAPPISSALASQGPGVGDGTASPELQNGIIFAFVAFFVMIFLANIGRR